MKIRMGFVSNSSSSSFCIFGRDIERSEILKIIDKTAEDDDYDIYECVYDAEEILKAAGLEIYQMPDCGSIYVGRSWDSIKDDETGKQFKDSISASLAKFFEDKKCGTCEEAWYDG